jgi:hypothetical protein
MAKTEVIETKPAVARELKPIKVSSVMLQDKGFVYKTAVVNMPDEVTLDDVGNRPELWKVLQSDRTGKALVEDDRVELRWLDKRVYAVVDFADSNGVSFCDIRKVSKRDRDRAPFNDGNYAVRWVSDGWTYFRLSDGQRMSNASYGTWEAAKAALIREMYPARIA